MKLFVALIAFFVFVPSAWAQAPVLPDIEMEVPYDLQVTTDGGGRSYVAFAAKVINKGPGVLKVVGERANTLDPTMDATQILLDHHSVQNGKPVQTRPAGQFEFSPSADHNHWHYLRFEDYNLLTVPDLQLASPTRKTGFCLLGLDLNFWCGHQQPDLLEIGGPLDYDENSTNPDTEAMGMVVENGWDINGNRASEDEYGPTVEGQDIEISNVAEGRYCLSFIVNPEGKLIEAGDGKNNGASTLIDVGGTPGGARSVAEVPGGAKLGSATCGITPPGAEPDPDPPAGGSSNPTGGGSTTTGGGSTTTGGGSTTTGGGGGGPANTPVGLLALSSSQSSSFALNAVKKAVTKPRSVARTCSVLKVTQATCGVTFKLGGARYSGKVKISQRLRAAAGFWFYALDATRKSVGSCEHSRDCPRRVKTKWLLGGAVGANRVAAKRALRLPSGDEVRSNPGGAWPDSMLPPEGQAQVRAYEPAG